MAADTFRRSLFGYRPSEVGEAIDVLESELGRRAEALRGREGEVKRLSAETAWLKARLAESEEHSNHLRVELSDAGARADDAIAALSALTGQLEELRIGAR